MKTLISTDTSSVLNYELFKKHGISVFPLNCIVDGEEFLDGVTITQDKLKDDMRSGKNIKTSTPPLGEIIEYFEKLFAEGWDKIIHFTISSKLSSMYDLFSNVAAANFPGKLFVIDSYALSTAMLSSVLFAYDEMKKGTEPEKICELVEKRKTDNVNVFIPENLSALKNGGRVSPTMAAIGNTLGIKPVLTLTDGKLEKECMARHARRTMTEKISEFLEKYSPQDYDYTIVDFDGKKEVLDYVYEYACNALGDYKPLRGLLPINVCAHCGPGTIGILVSPKINGKSLHDFL